MSTPRKPLTPEQGAALTLYKMEHGRFWKRTLLKAWREGTDATLPGGCYLRQLRNTLGPLWLQRY